MGWHRDGSVTITIRVATQPAPAGKPGERAVVQREVGRADVLSALGKLALVGAVGAGVVYLVQKKKKG